MRTKGIWTAQSLFSCFFWNALLIAVLYLMAKQIFHGLHQWVDPFVQPGAANLPEDARSAFTNLNSFINQMQQYAASIIFGLGAAVTSILWLFVMLQGRALINKTERELSLLAEALPPPSKEEGHAAGRPGATAIAPRQDVKASSQSAVQVLSILQREGRLIDFLQEDLNSYEDAQIGAAVRSIHQGCRDALSGFVKLTPIFEDPEGVEVTVPPGFDSRAIRLTGHVTGDPPFSGVLRHRGWRIESLELPQTTFEQDRGWVLAPAEVEIEGPDHNPS